MEGQKRRFSIIDKYAQWRRPQRDQEAPTVKKPDRSRLYLGAAAAITLFSLHHQDHAGGKRRMFRPVETIQRGVETSENAYKQVIFQTSNQV